MLQEGAVIGGRYRLSSLIGEGGMASVWRAEDDTLKRPVAIKLLYVRAHRDPQSVVDQFLREARLAASVQHRNVIHTVDFGVTAEHMPYMVMELLDGESLSERMSRSPALRMEEVVHIASLTLRGLAAVHAAGIVHRDLKPQNIFLQRDAESLFPKILDFGISRSLGGPSQSAVATQQGLIVGTPEYMAPEQARGDVDIDQRADIYAMGAIIYEGITGRVPFEASSLADLIMKIVTTTPLPMRAVRPDCPQVLSDCVEQAMSPDRRDRFPDAAVFRRALSNAAEKCFASHMFVSDAPLGHDRHSLAPRQVALERATPANTQAETLPMAAAAGTGVAWGGFADLENRPARRASSARQPAVSVAAGPPAAAAQPVASRGAAVAPPRTVTRVAPSPSRPETPQVAHDETMFGDDPLDSFAGTPGALELDVSGPMVPRGAGVAATTAEKAGRRSHSNAQPVPLGDSTPSAAIWIVPLVLMLGFALLLLAPSLFSPALPDDPAAAKREAENPAVEGGGRYGDGNPRPRLGSVAPALRDVRF